MESPSRVVVIVTPGHALVRIFCKDCIPERGVSPTVVH